jgi:hypothetical protein
MQVLKIILMTAFAALFTIVMVPVLLGYSILLIAIVIAAALVWIMGYPVKVKRDGQVLGYVKRGKFHKV